MPAKFTEQLNRKADAFETYHSEGTSLSVQFENDRLMEIRQGESSGVGIRAVKHGKIGFSYSSKKDEIEEVADSALRLAPFGKPYRFEFARPAQNAATLPFDDRCGTLSVEKMVQLGNRIKDVIKSVDAQAMAECSLSGGLGRSRIVTSGGQECIQKASQFGWSASAKFSEEGNFLYTYKYRSAPALIDEAEILAGAKEAVEELVIARKVVPFSPGSFPVLFSPAAFSDILTPIGVSINGINIARKTSSFVEKMGEKLFDERLTLTDDPVHAQGCAGSLYDGEGIVTQKRALVDRGVLRGFIHTLSTAQECGHSPTGNASRSVSSQPVPGTHNVVMEAGPDEKAELMRKSEGGLYITQLLGTFTSNFLAGQVSGNISLGFLVKDGRPAGRVKNCAFNVNAFDVLNSRIIGISKQRQWVGSEYLPWVLIDGVQISAR